MRFTRWMAMFACSVLLLGSTAVRAETARGELDGRTFQGDICKNGKPTGEKDTLTFRDGRLDSVACHKYGFGDGVYTTSQESDGVRFHAVTLGKRGRIVWTGVIKGEEAEGRFVFHRRKTWYTFFLPDKQESEFKAKAAK